MLKKGQLLTAHNLNNAYLSKINSASQTIAGPVTFLGAITGSLSGNASTATKLATGRTISLTGNVTGVSPAFDGSGNISFATTIADNAVITAKINNAAVTYAKIQNVTANRILGRLSTAGTVQELTAANIRSFINVADNADNYNHWKLHTADTFRANIGSGNIVNFKAGSNVSISYSATNNTITISSSYTDTNTATAVDNILDGSNSGTAITYAPYTTNLATTGNRFYTYDAMPTATTLLNLSSHLRITQGTVGTTLTVNGDIIGNGKVIARTTDSWLRLNPTYTSSPPATAFHSGVLIPSALSVSGNVGIGTTAPAYKLDVSGDVRATGRVTTRISSGGTSIVDGSSNSALRIETTSTSVAPRFGISWSKGRDHSYTIAAIEPYVNSGWPTDLRFLLSSNGSNIVEQMRLYANGNLSFSGTLTGGTVPWARISGAPTTATRWPSWSEVTGKPSTFAPSSHSHGAGDLPSATTSAKGVVQLSSAVNSTSTSLAATASAVKSAYDLANSKWTYNEATIKAIKVNNAVTADSANSVTWGNVTGKPSTFAPSSHKHVELTISDIRNTNPTPDELSGRRVTTFFNNQYGDTWRSGITVAGWSTGYTVWQLSNPSSITLNESLMFRAGIGESWSPWRTIWHSGNLTPYSHPSTHPATMITGLHASATTGAASTATTLATARTINGTSFNGSANITTANWGTARIITIGSTGKSVNGSGNVSWTLAEIGAAPASHTHSYAPVSHTHPYLPLTGGTLTGDLTAANTLAVSQTSGTAGGISLYSGVGSVTAYGIAFRTTANQGTHGKVTGDWATYFFMSGATNRGWVFKHAANNVASISGTGELTASKVYNAVYNDYAEYFLKNEEIEAGDIVQKNPDGNGYIKSQDAHSKLVVGVMSTDYAQCIGGDKNVTPEEQEKKYTPIGLSGRVPVKVVGRVELGDLIVSSHIPGVGMASKEYIPGTVVGKALENYDSKEVGKIEMLIMNI